MWKSAEEEQEMLKTAGIVNKYIETHDQEQNTTVPTNVRCSGVCDWLLKNCYADLHGNISMCCRNLIYRREMWKKKAISSLLECAAA